MRAAPLSGIKVIDLTRGRAGPTAVRMLADWGADVLKVEAPGGGDGGGLSVARGDPDFQNIHRNKRSLTLDLRKPEALPILHRLVEDADVVVENYRPTVKHRLKVDYESLRAINPRLIYGSISGFGQDGPYRDRPGVDQIVQGMGGLMSITGSPGGGPVRVGIAIADVMSGVFCAVGMLLALLEREKSGKGQWVTTSLLESTISMLDFQAVRWLIDNEIPGQVGNNHPTSIPTGVFKTADGEINIAAIGGLYPRLCRALNADNLATDPDFATGEARLEHRDRLNAAIEAITRTKPSAEWIDILNRAGVPCGPIYRIDQVFADPAVQHMGIAQSVERPTRGRADLLGQAVWLSRTPSALRTPAPERGEHTEVVLRGLGYDDAAIAGMRADAIV
jgi:crotonobetainyl-CoA:carnitine CoA-transferase CaiB-like acyl-CoA transferase